MADWKLNTPVAFFIFNRPDTTRRVFEEIAKAAPPRLYVIADGPRANREGEAQRCAQTRAIIEQVNWPCEVITNFSERNLGCRNRVASGIDWLFEHVEEAILLEDDCLPHPTFFRFCEELLHKYRHDQRIGMISGDNFQRGRRVSDGSYYFSKYTHIWGWATWRRAWQQYDVQARNWPEFLSSGRFDGISLPIERDSWREAFEGVHRGRIDTWDYQWTLTCWSRSMLAVMPEVNLISNIGFGADATHTLKETSVANLPTSAMTWPLKEPGILAAYDSADAFTAIEQFRVGVRGRVRRLIKRGLKQAKSVVRIG